MIPTSKIQALAASIYNQNKKVGWWDDPNRCLPTCAMLIITELSEAMEGVRKDKMDDHLPHRKMFEVELADALIRTLDLGEHLGLELENFSYHYNFCSRVLETCKGSEGELLLLLCCKVVHWASSHLAEPGRYTELVASIWAVSDYHDVDLLGATLEKLKYNKNRLDHKRENRAKEGGKKL